jgi:hypothetical protein
MATTAALRELTEQLGTATERALAAAIAQDVAALHAMLDQRDRLTVEIGALCRARRTEPGAGPSPTAAELQPVIGGVVASHQATERLLSGVAAARDAVAAELRRLQRDQTANVAYVAPGRRGVGAVDVTR